MSALTYRNKARDLAAQIAELKDQLLLWKSIAESRYDAMTKVDSSLTAVYNEALRVATVADVGVLAAPIEPNPKEKMSGRRLAEVSSSKAVYIGKILDALVEDMAERSKTVNWIVEEGTKVLQSLDEATPEDLEDASEEVTSRIRTRRKDKRASPPRSRRTSFYIPTHSPILEEYHYGGQWISAATDTTDTEDEEPQEDVCHEDNLCRPDNQPQAEPPVDLEPDSHD